MQIDVPLRQHRAYLHSTNLFDFLVGRTGAQHNLSLTFRRKITAECDAFPAAEVGNAGQCPARFTGRIGPEAIDLVLIEREPRIALSHREPYDEDAVAAGSRIEDPSIFSDRANGATPIERIVALNKRLVAQTVAPQKVLVFSKVFLQFVPASTASMQLSLKSRLGVTLFRSAIRADGQEIGEIVFYGT